MKGRGGGTGCGTRVVPVVLSGSFVAVERGETLNTDTQTQESEVYRYTHDIHVTTSS